MSKVIMVGCDLHDASMVLKVAVGRDDLVKKEFRNTRSGREKLIRWLQAMSRRVHADRVVFGYEASGQGFGLHDQLTWKNELCLPSGGLGEVRGAGETLPVGCGITSVRC